MKTFLTILLFVGALALYIYIESTLVKWYKKVTKPKKYKPIEEHFDWTGEKPKVGDLCQTPESNYSYLVLEENVFDLYSTPFHPMDEGYVCLKDNKKFFIKKNKVFKINQD